MLHPRVERGWGSIKVRHHRQEAGNGQPWWSWCPSYENPALNIKVLLKDTEGGGIRAALSGERGDTVLKAEPKANSVLCLTRLFEAPL